MVQKQDRERVRTLLKDTITLLCKNGLEFKAKFNLEALIGVTIDDDDVFLISINELVKSDSYVSPQPSEGDEQVAEDSDSGGTRRRRKRRRSRGIKIKVESGGGSDQEDTAQFNESEEDNDDDSSRFDETEPKRPKAEPKSDIIIIKEEIEDNWLQSTSQVDFSQFQNTSLDSSSGGGGMSQSTTASWLPPSSSQAQYSPGSLSMTQPVGSMVGMSPGQGFPVQQQSGQQQLFNMCSSPFACSICPRTFADEKSKENHEILHKTTYKHHCFICKKGFTVKTDFEGHMAQHAGQKPHKCQLCQKEYSHKKSLQDHMRFVHRVLKR